VAIFSPLTWKLENKNSEKKGEKKLPFFTLLFVEVFFIFYFVFIIALYKYFKLNIRNDFQQVNETKGESHNGWDVR
jgi:hypothetical protein